MSLLTDEIRAWIGREAVFEAPEEIGHAAIRYYALAVGDDNPLYTDEVYARAHGYAGVIAPPTMICETNQVVRGPRDEQGYLTQMFDLVVPNTRQVRGGNAYEFFRPVRPDDRVTVTWRLQDIDERSSATGASMLVVTSVATYADASGELLARNTETVLYVERR